MIGTERLLLALAILIAGGGLSVVLNEAVTWSNPEYLAFSVPGAMDMGAAVSWRDWSKAFDPLSFDVVRPRFLNYLITVLNVKFRLALYPYFVPPVNLSLMLVTHLIFSPLLLFLTVRNLFDSRPIALAATCLYVASVGFLSTSVFFVQPGKILVHPLTLLLLWLLSRMHRAGTGRFFVDQPRPLIACVLAMNLIVLSIDDTYAVSAIAACALFWRFFLPDSLLPARITRAALSLVVFFVPFLLFAAFVWKIAPEISAAAGAGRCDYIGSVLAQSTNTVRTPFLPLLRDLASTNLAGTLLPLPFADAPSPVLVKVTLLETLAVGALLAAIALFAFLARSREAYGSMAIADALIGLVVFFLMQAVVQRFHPQITGGYYYGSLGAIFVSIMFAAVLAHLRPAARTAAYGATVVLILFQLGNFLDLNGRWKSLHIELIPYSLSTVRGIYKNVVIDDGARRTPEQKARMAAIWNNWKNGVREDLSTHSAWPASQAWFLVELNALSGFVYRDPKKLCSTVN